MAYDPTLPVNNSLVSSSELRNQFNGLKTLVDDRPTNGEMISYVESFVPANAATNILGLTDLSGLTISDPPTQAEVETIRQKINELIGALQAH